MTHEKKIEKYPVELKEDECQLILDNAMVFDLLQKSLKKAAKIEGSHTIMMTLLEIQDIAGWLAAEANHATDERKEMELGNLYEYFDGLEYDCKRQRR